MAKKSSFEILNTNSWERAKRFVTQPVTIQTVRGKKLLLNSETKKAYGLRSASYELIRHEAALDTLHKALLLEQKPFELVSVQLDNSGARMYAHVRFQEEYGFSSGIVLTNSYDGTLSFGIDSAIFTSHGLFMMFDTVERWIHFGNTADVENFRRAIRKAIRDVRDKWAPKMEDLNAIRLPNPRLSVEWFQDRERKFITLPIVKAVLEDQPYTGRQLWLALGKAISDYETSPTRKRDMYFAISNAFYYLRRWVDPVDRRRVAPENRETSG